MKKPLDISNQRFGKLTAIEFSHEDKDGIHFWIFKCDCGVTKAIGKSKVITGRTVSCGCYMVECRITHGFTACEKKDYPKIYKTWMSMKNRCHNKNEKAYRLYGAKGIFVCDEWHQFENFYRDMGDPPTAKHTIDRIDPTKGYSKDNCRWITNAEQARNKLKNTNINTTSKYKGVEKMKNGRLRARIGIGNKKVSAGCYETEIEAAIAYNEAAIKYHGEFAQLNEITKKEV